MSDTVSVVITVDSVEPMAGCGALLAIATVTIAIHDVELTLRGCQIRRLPDGRRIAGAPRWRHPRSGEWLPCIVADDSLTGALGAEINAAFEEMAA